jgi:RNA polymerase sigma-70 factor (ECF subfamily)
MSLPAHAKKRALGRASGRPCCANAPQALAAGRTCVRRWPRGVTRVTELAPLLSHALFVPVADQAAAVDTLFDAHHDRIYRYLLRMIRDRAEAEDLTQETFLRAHLHWESLRDPEAVRGWLYRIATHVCLDRLRRRKPQVSLDDEEGAHRLDSAISAALSAQELVEREETSRCVQRCLDFLPDAYRAVILLYEAHSLTAAEIAALLGLPLTTVKMRLHRAHRMLQQVMECGCVVSSDRRGRPVCQPRHPDGMPALSESASRRGRSGR